MTLAVKVALNPNTTNQPTTVLQTQVTFVPSVDNCLFVPGVDQDYAVLTVL